MGGQGIVAGSPPPLALGLEARGSKGGRLAASGFLTALLLAFYQGRLR